MSEPQNDPDDAPPGSPERVRAEESARRQAEKDAIAPTGFRGRLRFVGNKKQRSQLIENIKSKAPRKEHIAQDTLSLIATLIRVIISIVGPIFSALSIWVSVVGIAFTIFSGVEPFIQLAHWVRFITIKWRNFTHYIWDVIGPYIGFEIPIDLKDFATFVTMLSIALILGFLSNGKRLVLYDSIVGMRMAIYGITHAINSSREDGTRRGTKSLLHLLFFEVNTFLKTHFSRFFVYSVPFLTVFNLFIRIGLVFIPMIILVPERAFAEFFDVKATRVEYLFLSACISYFAALIVLFCGLFHIVLHFVRAIYVFLKTWVLHRAEICGERTLNRFKKAKSEAKFGLTYVSNDPMRKLWHEQVFLARFSVSLIRSNWVWWPISTAEKAHRKVDPFLWLSERRFADPAFLDRIAKGLFLFFILFVLNWISINGENIASMFEPPQAEPQ